MPMVKQALSVFLSISVMFSVMGLDGCSKKPEPAQTAATQAGVTTAGACHDLRRANGRPALSTGRSHRALSRQPGRHGAGCLHLSRPGQRRLSMAAAELEPQGPAAYRGRQSAALGRERERSDAVFRCTESDGHQSVVDLRSGRCVLQHSAERDERRAGHAPARLSGRKPEEQPAAERHRAEPGSGNGAASDDRRGRHRR